MNQLRIILTAGVAMAGLALAVPSASHPDKGTTEETRTIKIIKTDGDKKVAINSDKVFVADCGQGRKFESTASKSDDAKKKSVSKLVLCSDPGESNEAWAKTLREALANVEGNKDMPADAKAQIVADLKSEIARTGK